MKMRLAALLVSMTLCSSAYAQSLGEKTGVNSALGITPTTADFIKEVAASDKFEIESSKLAQEKSQGPVKEFASQMITDHTTTTKELSSQAQNINASVPTTLDGSLQAKLDALRPLSGADFDKQYVEDQINAHSEAVSLFQRYGKGGDSADLRRWAVTMLPTLQHHLEMAENLRK
jgi:putative membrane protein